MGLDGSEGTDLSVPGGRVDVPSPLLSRRERRSPTPRGVQRATSPNPRRLRAHSKGTSSLHDAVEDERHRAQGQHEERHHGSELPPQGQRGTGFKEERHHGPELPPQGQQGTGFKEERHHGPELPPQGQQGTGFKEERHHGPELPPQGQQATGFKEEWHHGPELPPQGQRGTYFKEERHHGPELPAQGQQGTGFKEEWHHGPELPAQGQQATGFKEERHHGPELPAQGQQGIKEEHYRPELPAQGKDTSVKEGLYKARSSPRPDSPDIFAEIEELMGGVHAMVTEANFGMAEESVGGGGGGGGRSRESDTAQLDMFNETGQHLEPDGGGGGTLGAAIPPRVQQTSSALSAEQLGRSGHEQVVERAVMEKENAASTPKEAAYLSTEAKRQPISIGTESYGSQETMMWAERGGREIEGSKNVSEERHGGREEVDVGEAAVQGDQEEGGGGGGDAKLSSHEKLL